MSTVFNVQHNVWLTKSNYNVAASATHLYTFFKIKQISLLSWIAEKESKIWCCYGDSKPSFVYSSRAWRSETDMKPTIFIKYL